MTTIDARLREEVHLLGELLGETFRVQLGDAFLDKIERIRIGAKGARRGSPEAAAQLAATLDGLRDPSRHRHARARTVRGGLFLLQGTSPATSGVSPTCRAPTRITRRRRGR